MIPQIKIAEAFQEKKHVKDYTSFMSGVRFAESELKSVAMEFHIEAIKQGLIDEGGKKKWSDDYEPMVRKTAEEVWVKFMEERATQ